MTNPDSNVFDSSAEALKWAQANRVNGLAADALAAAGSEAPPAESLVFHNVPYLLPDDADSSIVAREFTTSCLLRSDDAERLHGREPLSPALAPQTSAFVVQKVTVPAIQRMARANDVGMHASRAIASSEVIVVERPTLLLPSHLWLGAMNQDALQIIVTLLSRLPQTQASAVKNLKNAKPKPISVEEGIVRTNGLAVDLGNGGPAYTGILLNISRCNHSCTPNAAVHWNPDTFTMTLSAVRDIAKGGEITIAYLDILLPFTTRRVSLKATYGFDCHCEKCSSSLKSADDRQKSDIARAKLRSWAFDPNRLTFTRWFASTDPASGKSVQDRKKETSEFASLLTGLIKVYAAEKIHVVQAPLLEIADAAVRLRGALGDGKNFSKQLEAAVKIWKQEEAFCVHARRRLASYQKWSDAPESFPLWGKRADVRPDPKVTAGAVEK